MANPNKFTTKEVLNKVLLDSSGNAVTANSVTAQEALNTVLDTTNNRLNMSLAGGTISGDVTISGDLTVSGSNTYTYDEQIDGQLWLKDSTTSSATQGGHLRLFSDDGAAMAAGHRLGVIEFAGAEDASSTITVGAKIESLAESTFTASENGSNLLFYTTDADASTTEKMRITSDGNVGIGTTPSYQLHTTGTVRHEDSALVLNLYDSQAYSAGSSGARVRLQGKDSAENEKNLVDLIGTSRGANQGEFQVKVRNSSGNYTEYLRIEDDGASTIGVHDATANSFGIGSNPTITANTTKVDIGNGNTAVSQIRLKDNEATDGWYLESNQNFALGYNTTDTINITQAGLVGIGTTSPSYNLHIAGTRAQIDGDTPVIVLKDTSSYLQNTGAQLVFQGIDSGGTNRDFGYIQGSSRGSDDGALDFYTRGSGSNTIKMRISEGGNVGIGTSTSDPEAQVEIQGSSNAAYAEGTAGLTNGATLFIQNTDNTANAYSQIILGTRSSSVPLTRIVSMNVGSNDADLAFVLNNSERMRIDGSTGNVGIGESSAVTMLDVHSTNATVGVEIPASFGMADDGDAYINVRTGAAINSKSGVAFQASGTASVTGVGSSNHMAWIYANKVTADACDGELIFATNSIGGSLSTKLTIAADGTFTGSSSNDISDGELKENIKDIENGLDTINKLQGRTFTWKESADMQKGTKYGVIAQEIEKVLPDLVYNETGIREKGEEGSRDFYKSVNVTGIIPVLIEAVKELSAKVEALESK